MSENREPTNQPSNIDTNSKGFRVPEPIPLSSPLSSGFVVTGGQRVPPPPPQARVSPTSSGENSSTPQNPTSSEVRPILTSTNPQKGISE